MDYKDAGVEVLTVPGWLAEEWLSMPNGSVVGEVNTNGNVSVKSSSSSKAGDAKSSGGDDAKPRTFKAVIVREPKGTFAIDIASSAKRKTVEKISRVNSLQPVDEEEQYRTMLQERVNKEQHKIKLVDERPALRKDVVVDNTKRGGGDKKEGAGGGAKRRKKG